MNRPYVHGYDHRETLRLQDQASTLVELLHSDTSYPPGSRVLEAGCGVGAQTVTLARNSPERFDHVRRHFRGAPLSRPSEKRRPRASRTSIFNRPTSFTCHSGPESFDHVFVCFVLEHLPRPVEALRALKSHLRKGGTITVIEGDHGSAYFHPDSEAARRAIQCQVELQRRPAATP